MLGRDLLRWRRKGPVIEPQWLGLTPARRRLAEEVLAAFGDMRGQSRRRFDEAMQLVVQRAGSVPVARGLVKLVDDAATWQEVGSFAEKRRAILDFAARALTQATDHDAYRELVAGHFAATAASISEELYGDLPQQSTLLEVPHWSAEELIARYNCALVQGLVGASQEVSVELREHPQLTQSEALRSVLRAAAFHRIVVTAHATQEKGAACMRIVCSGPAAVLEQQNAYASNLALLVPAILGLPGGWCLRARLDDKRRDLCGEILIDPDDAVFPARHAAFIPPEIRAAGEALATKLGSGWQVAPGLPQTLVTGQLVAPDWQCTGPQQQHACIEVFHRWHAGVLRQRLNHYDDLEQPWLIAVDRALLKKKENLELAQHPVITKQAILFSSMPTANTLAKAVKNYFSET